MFFDIEKEIDKNVLSESLKFDNGQSASVTTISSGKGLLVVGDSIGMFFLLKSQVPSPRYYDFKFFRTIAPV